MYKAMANLNFQKMSGTFLGPPGGIGGSGEASWTPKTKFSKIHNFQKQF